jgi:hypothetical protein
MGVVFAITGFIAVKYSHSHAQQINQTFSLLFLAVAFMWAPAKIGFFWEGHSADHAPAEPG